MSCALSGRKPRRFGATPGSDEMRARPALRGARWPLGQNTICGVLSKADFGREGVSETAIRRCVSPWWLIAGLAIHWLRWHQLVQSPPRRGIANRSRLKSRSRGSRFREQRHNCGAVSKSGRRVKSWPGTVGGINPTLHRRMCAGAALGGNCGAVSTPGCTVKSWPGTVGGMNPTLRKRLCASVAPGGNLDAVQGRWDLANRSG